MALEYIIEICVAIDIAILSIAYPIIVDKISNIGDKYSSEYIPVLFNNEFPQRTLKVNINNKEYAHPFFKWTLFATLFSFTLLIFKFQPLFCWDNWIINHSARLIVLILTILLVVLFFIWLDKVALYNGKSKSLLTHIISSYLSSTSNTEMQNYNLKAINEIAYYAIEKQDEHLQKTLLEFYYLVFANIRKNHDKSKPLIYPVDLYFLVNKLNEIAQKIKTNLRAIEHRAVSGSWLLGEDFEDISISEETFSWLWRNIYIICENPRLVKMFWANTSQYFEFRLKSVIPDYVSQNTGIIINNQVHIEKRIEERKMFLEFHYALGGLLLYKKQYKTIEYLFQYSQSHPPNYPLLPQTTTEIFQWFEYFRNEFKHKTPIDLKYFFPELDNLGNRRQVNYWICCYVAILFVRQYSLQKYYTYQNFTAQPNLPDDVVTLSSWLDSVSFFEKCLKDILINQELILNLEFEKIIEVKREDIKSFTTNLSEAIKNKIGQQKLNAELSEDKIQIFKTKSNDIIVGAFEIYKPIFTTKDNEHTISELKISINGERTLISKSAFTDNDIPNINFDTVFAEAIAVNKIKRIIPNSFAIARTKRYLLNRENFIAALNKIIGNNNDFIIIGVNLNYHTKEVIDESKYKNSIINIPSTEYYSVDTLFILRKKDLPAIEYNDLKEDEISELKLECINKELYIYASVVDINKKENEIIKDQWDLENEPDNQDLKVQIAIAFLSTIYWKNKREVIQINIASEYREQGIQNDINDVITLLSDTE